MYCFCSLPSLALPTQRTRFAHSLTYFTHLLTPLPPPSHSLTRFARVARTAIRVKLLTARLHQPSSTISILQASPRRFSTAQWELLQSRLENWKNSIANIQETVGRALGGRQGQQQQQQQQQGQQQGSANAQDVVNAHVEKGQETQQPVVEVA